MKRLEMKIDKKVIEIVKSMETKFTKDLSSVTNAIKVIQNDNLRKTQEIVCKISKSFEVFKDFNFQGFEITVPSRSHVSYNEIVDSEILNSGFDFVEIFNKQKIGYSVPFEDNR